MKTLKRTLSALLCVLMILSCCATFGSAASEGKFIDVVKGSWYYDGVMWAVEKGYFAGMTANTFIPNGVLTRGQFVTVLAALDDTDTAPYRNITNFTDVKTGNYYTSAVEWARQNAIVGGTGNGTFSPALSVTREQLCVMLKVFVTEYLGYELDYVNAQVKYNDDAQISSWAKDAVTWAQRCGLVSGMGGNNFSPKTGCTRAQTALIIKKLVEAIPQKIVAYFNMNVNAMYDSEDIKAIDIYNIHPTNVIVGANNSGASPFKFGYSASMLNYKRNMILKDNPDAKFIFTVGNGALATFESWLMPYDNCKRFADHFVDAVRSYGFDGVDIDYEFPTGEALRPNFVKFIEYLREGLDDLSKITGKKYTISLAVPAGSWAFSLFDIKGLSEYIDWFNIMNYDLYIGATYNMYTHHHTPAYDNVDTINYKIPAGGSVASDIKLYKQNGIPAAKIVAGCGMVGYTWEYVEPGKLGTGLFSYGKWNSQKCDYYNSLITGKVNKAGYVRYWDDASKAPYLYNAETKEFITYDDLESVSYKADLVNKGLVRGLMMFDYCTCAGCDFFSTVNGYLNRSK